MSALSIRFRKNLAKRQRMILAARIRQLDSKITRTAQGPFASSLHLGRLKRLRLALKDELMQLARPRNRIPA
ncbi:MAG: YdcH family protein [Pseudomonadota bacterium]